MTDTKNIVTIVAYMLGLKDETLEKVYEENLEQINELRKNKEATIIRYLCKIRTSLIRNFKKIDNLMVFDLKNLNTIEEYFEKKEIGQLKKWGIDIIKANYRAQLYVDDVTRYINENIDACSSLFYDWVNWEYIRDLFYVSLSGKQNTMKREYELYVTNFAQYPFHLYVHLDFLDLPASDAEPNNGGESGNMLYSDWKFLRLIYNKHNDVFEEVSNLYQGIDEETRINIHDFISKSKKTAIAVDCENSDLFKLYSTLISLSVEERKKIQKITLYDDINTDEGWKWLAECIDIPTEHIIVDRVLDRKSLVDIKMTASVCKDFYDSNIDSFLLVSSDSDFWGLVQTLNEANFLIMYERAICSKAMQKTLNEHGYYYCCIDDFCTAGTDKLKRKILLTELEKQFPTIYGTNCRELTDRLYKNTKIRASEKEKEQFCNKFIRTLKLKIDSEGIIKFEINQ